MSLTASALNDLRVPFKARVAAILKRDAKPDPLVGRFGPSLTHLIHLANAQVRDAQDARQHHRIPTLLSGVIVKDGIEIARCRVTDISSAGARLTLEQAAPVPQEFDLKLTGGRVIRAKRVRVIGLEFGVVFA